MSFDFLTNCSLPSLVCVAARDGMMEVVVGTSMGFLYMLDHLGKAVEGWPLQVWVHLENLLLN